MKSTFGIFTKSQGQVIFGRMQASLVNNEIDINNPINPNSPNRPRVPDREPGYVNPALGDPGKGQIGRWQTVNLDSLETVIDQIIEQYLRDKSWYANVRCREALWNMQKRLEWWVKQQVDPNRNDYQRAMLMIKDCIKHILEEAQDPALAHNVSLPTCPAPFYFPFNADYFNHFNGTDVERTLFDMKLLPKSDDFHGLFRYVSSVEDQEWEMVHSVGSNETTGSENIMKISLPQLYPGNSSKVTFNWRWKRMGYITFKYWASTTLGNGLNFFINNNQVGGEWSGNSGWQEVRFNVTPGQTYKFDWLVRKQSESLFGRNAVYIKDVKCVEVIRSLGGETPPDYDTMGSDAYGIPGFDWITFSHSSLVKTHFNGVVVDDRRSRTLIYHLDNECDGTVRFAYRMGTAEPILTDESFWMFLDNLVDRVQTGQGKHGSSVLAEHGPEWVLDGSSSSTVGDVATINYELIVGEGCTVDARGTVEIVCPPLEIDHYDDTTVKTLENSSWSQSGSLPWQVLGTTDRTLRLDNPTLGFGMIQTFVSLVDDGWFEFTFNHNLRSSETLQALVDGIVVFESKNLNYGQAVQIPLAKGGHTIAFRVEDTFTEQGVISTTTRAFSYGSATQGNVFTTSGIFGSSFSVQRNWNMSNAGASTSTDGQEINYTVNLNPGASFNISELLRLSAPINVSTSTLKFEELFNIKNGTHSPRITMTPNWEWEDIALRFHANYNPNVVNDGVFKVENKDGSINKMTLSGVVLTNPGYVEFEYGGRFAAKENLEFLIDGKVVWADSQSTTADSGTNVKLPVSSGNHTYQWVYRDLGGTTYTDPSTGGTVTESGETCFTAGNETTPVPYNLNTWWTQTARRSEYRVGGKNFYTSPTQHVAESNGATISRSIWFREYTDVNYYETLTIRAGNGIPKPSEMKPVNIGTLTVVNPVGRGLFKGSDYYCLNITGVGPVSQDDPENGAGWATGVFYTNGEIDLTFKFLAYLVDHYGLRNTGATKNASGLDADHRGDFSVHIIPEGGTPTVANRYFQWVDNQGLPQMYNDIYDWSGAKTYPLKETVPAGRYFLYFKMRDTLSDHDVDLQNKPYYVAIKDINLKASTLPTTEAATWDDTKVRVDLIDVRTWTILSTETHQLYGTESGSWNKVFTNLQPNIGYVVQYTLLRGDGTTGGVYDRGGTMQLSRGSFVEGWNPYCYDADGRYYSKGNSPYPPNTDPVTLPLPLQNSYCWIDAIKLYQSNRTICPGTGLHVTIQNGSTLEQDTYSAQGEQSVEVNVINHTSSFQTYYVTMRFLAGCTGDIGSLYNGSFRLTDKQFTNASYAEITDFTATNHKPVWMGGCYTSKMHVKVYNEVNAVVFSRNYTGAGVYSFLVSKLPQSPYSNYRVEIETEQGGEVSLVTGKEYLTTFKLVDFKAYENWKFIPDPFQGRLRFYIDGTLVGTYSTPSGGFNSVSFPVLKGAHEFKWIFTELGNGYSWDFCDIDLLELTKWVCDKVLVTPYCEQGGGDKCIEELIKCLLQIWNDRPKACTIGKKIWLFT